MEWNWNRAVAVVGTRKITNYGKEVTRQIIAGLVSAGCFIVSGLAYGVDAVAHATAIETGGFTIAVLGCGVDVIHPVSNTLLYNEIVNGKGWVISEYPVGQFATVGLFPARNRIISALSRGVVVTEGAFDSGALITARFAAEQGKDVFAVPGPITSSLSEGPMILMKNGAKPVAKAEDVLEELNIRNKPISTNNSITNKPMNKNEKIIIELLENENLHLDEIVRKSGIPAAKLGSILTVMEMKGWLKNTGGMYGIRN